MNNTRIKKAVKEYRALIVFFFLLYFFRIAYADYSPVPSGSMEPTIVPGDYLWIDKTSFGPSIPFINKKIITWGYPSRGDVITFVPPHTDRLFVKRVIAVPGDTIHIEGVRVYINGIQLEQRLIGKSDTGMIGEEKIGGINHRFKLSDGVRLPYVGKTIEIPEGKYFVMGDHRNNSSDSRYWGLVDQRNIMGKVTAIAVSFSRERELFNRVALPIK